MSYASLGADPRTTWVDKTNLSCGGAPFPMSDIFLSDTEATVRPRCDSYGLAFAAYNFCRDGKRSDDPGIAAMASQQSDGCTAATLGAVKERKVMVAVGALAVASVAAWLMLK